MRKVFDRASRAMNESRQTLRFRNELQIGRCGKPFDSRLPRVAIKLSMHLQVDKQWRSY
jgi:hypothetical protein